VRVGGDHGLQRAFVAAVATVAIGMIATDQFGVALAKRPAIGVLPEPENAKRAAILLAQRPTVGAGLAVLGVARADRVERIGEVAPSWAGVRVRREGARLALPTGERALLRIDLVGRHAFEEVIAAIERAHVIEAQPAPLARTIETRPPGARRTKFTELIAARFGAQSLARVHPPVEPIPSLPFTRPVCQDALPFPAKPFYISKMTDQFIGPVAAEITARLTAALAPTHLAVIDDSEKHRGHAGHSGSGESHFTVEIVSATFEGQSRVARQRAVNAALRELLVERVHALAIKAQAPSEL